MIWVLAGVIALALLLGPGLDWFVLGRKGGIKSEVKMPDGTSYVGIFGHWLPKLLGSDDTVIGGHPLFKLTFFASGQWAGTLASPSPGHLAHAGVHVRQQRDAGLTTGPFKVLRAAIWWQLHGTAAEKEADAYADKEGQADGHAADPFFVTQWERLRGMIKKAGA